MAASRAVRKTMALPLAAGLLAACLSGVGCGSSGLSQGGGDDAGRASGGTADGGKNEGGADLQPFIGTWTPTSSTTTLVCAGQSSTDQTSSDVVWQPGTTSDLLQPPDASGCPLLANVSGRTATAAPNQACRQTMGGASVVLTLTQYTFVVAASGTTATENGVGTGVVTMNGAQSSCTFSETAQYTKAP